MATHVGVDSATNNADQPATANPTGMPVTTDLGNQPATAGAAAAADASTEPAGATTPLQPDTKSTAATAASDNRPPVGPNPSTADMAFVSATIHRDNTFGPGNTHYVDFPVVNVNQLDPNVTITAYDAEDGTRLFEKYRGFLYTPGRSVRFVATHPDGTTTTMTWVPAPSTTALP